MGIKKKERSGERRRRRVCARKLIIDYVGKRNECKFKVTKNHGTFFFVDTGLGIQSNRNDRGGVRKYTKSIIVIIFSEVV